MCHTILLVDDEKSIRETLRIILEDSNYNVLTAKDGSEALEYIRGTIVDVLVTDLKMPKMDGIELMKNALEIDPYIETIIISAYADIKSAVKALKMGAFDYIEKSFYSDELIFTVKRAIERKILIEENRNLKRRIEGNYDYEGVIGKSEKIQKLFDMVNRIANSRANVLLTGESGAGKEVFAQLIHKKSSRSDKSFIVINCGAIPENLVESELFGHEKGAFTGADHLRKGKFELANGGTLFLDEVGELPLQAQVKFLRILQEKKMYRIGAEKPVDVDVRIIAATNKALTEQIENGKFREDLYYRLNVVNMEIPPLRERKEDIPLLCEKFLMEFAEEYNKKLKFIDAESLSYLMDYSWKGNVRELRNIIERSVLVANYHEEFLLKKHLPKEITGVESVDSTEGNREISLNDYEKIIIENTLRKYGLNKTKAAEVLGIKRQTLYNKIKEYNINI
jgi:DNA-binding NtrC family response regulator